MKDRRKQATQITTLTTGGGRPPYHVAAPETLHDLLQRDLEAWIAVKAAITKAQGA